MAVFMPSGLVSVEPVKTQTSEQLLLMELIRALIFVRGAEARFRRGSHTLVVTLVVVYDTFKHTR